MRISTESVRPGDTLEVWWPPKQDTITAIRDHNGPLECLCGARVATFAIWTIGMTLEPGAVHEVVARRGEAAS